VVHCVKCCSRASSCEEGVLSKIRGETKRWQERAMSTKTVDGSSTNVNAE
jgi:hypothetical protein